MSDVSDSDIEFDFFEEPATPEPQERQRTVRRGPRPPGRSPGGFTPLLRLIGLIAFAIVIVVLLVFWIQSCRGASKTSTYANYMDDVGGVAADSSQIGGQLNQLLTSRTVKQADMVRRLNGLAQQQQQGVTTAENIDPPGRLRGEHTDMISALQFRVSGLTGLANAFRRTANVKDADKAGQLLAGQAKRLDASDVVWLDRFKDPSIRVLQDEDIGGVQVPSSRFVKNPELATSASMKQVWQRIHATSTAAPAAGGLHGNGIDKVTVQPSGQELSQDSDTTIVATTDLAFQVAVTNSGDSQEVQVPVTLTIQKTPSPIVKTQTIDLINPGETKTLTFRDLGQPPFGNKTTVAVDVKPVPGETNKTNNSAEYPVFFSISNP